MDYRCQRWLIFSEYVNQGLRNITFWVCEEASKISAHTRNYLAENERAIRRFVDSLPSNVSAGREDASQLEDVWSMPCLLKGAKVLSVECEIWHSLLQ